MMDSEDAVNKLLFCLLYDTESSDSEYSSDDSELLSDDEPPIVPFHPVAKRQTQEMPRMKGYIQEVVFRMNEIEFKSHFRLSRAVVQSVGNMIMSDPQSENIQTESLWQQLLMTLWILATPETFKAVADRFDVSKSSLWMAVTQMCSAIARLSVTIIKWPSIADMETSEQSFKQIAGFPGVIGCVGSTHISISTPKEDPSLYVNRKGSHSIILQGIANSRLQFIDCYAGEVGSVHEGDVFERSNIGEQLSQTIPEDFHLLGDHAHPLKDNLLTPFQDNGHLTRQQVIYNKKLLQTRYTVERAFGLLKGRFQRLKLLKMLRTDLMPTYVMASCVLHNILQEEDSDVDESLLSLEEDDDCDDEEDWQTEQPTSTAVAKRKRIMNSL